MRCWQRAIMCRRGKKKKGNKDNSNEGRNIHRIEYGILGTCVLDVPASDTPLATIAAMLTALPVCAPGLSTCPISSLALPTSTASFTGQRLART